MDQTLQTVFQLGFRHYASQHKLPLYYHKAARQIMSCRTSVLGGHSVYCKNNHFNGVWYNSCKHRACPQCNGIGLHRWVERQKDRLLNCRHIHIVFPLAHEYLESWRFNTDTMTELMFKAAKESLKDLLMDDPQKKYLDAQPGFIMALHTWGRDLSLHPHIHCMITEGGFKGQQWVTSKRSVLLPARVLRAKYQGKLNNFIRKAAQQAHWQYPDGMHYQQLVNLSNKLGRKKWHVYIKEHFSYSGPLLKYLINYMRGGPLKNPQITAVNHQQVTFRYYAHRKNPRGKKEHPSYRTECLDDFFKLYLQHIPRFGTQLIRHYGLYANVNSHRLNLARAELGQPDISPKAEYPVLSWIDYLRQFLGTKEKTQCKRCQQALSTFKALPRLSLAELLEQRHAPP